MKIFNYEIKEDKINHVLYWILGTLALTIIFGPKFAAFGAVTAGILKEIYDKFCGSGQFDTEDLLADVIGIIIALITCKIAL